MTGKLRPTLTRIKLLQKSRQIELDFADGQHFVLSCEYLRVSSPSAEVRGHSGRPKLITNKENVNIVAIEPIGHYALKLVFDDGHDTGIYTWDFLYDLAINYDKNWQDYLSRKAKQADEQRLSK